VHGLELLNGECSSICGDMVLYDPVEDCDDGNLDNNDGCS
jgi:cysteine-rich repeat protein